MRSCLLGLAFALFFSAFSLAEEHIADANPFVIMNRQQWVKKKDLKDAPDIRYYNYKPRNYYFKPPVYVYKGPEYGYYYTPGQYYDNLYYYKGYYYRTDPGVALYYGIEHR